MLNRPVQRAMCPSYVLGLIGLGDCKSIRLMAVRAEGIRHDSQHHDPPPLKWSSPMYGFRAWRMDHGKTTEARGDWYASGEDRGSCRRGGG